MKKLVRRKSVFKGRLISVYIQTEKYPNNYIADLEVVKHPGAVLIVPMLDRDKVILIRQYRPVISSYIWELPAGTLKKGENPLACLKRELIEEIGYKAGMSKRIGHIYPAPGYTTENILIYKAWKLSKTQPELEEDEIITPKIFRKKEIKKMLKSGRIVDAKTICALKLANIL